MRPQSLVLTLLSLLPLAVEGSKTITVTHTEFVTVTPASGDQLRVRQNDGQWTPEATFLSPTQTPPASWVNTWVPSAPVPTWTAEAEPTVDNSEYAKTPGEGPDKGRFGSTLIIVLVAVLVGLPMVCCLIFYLKKSRCFGWRWSDKQEKARLAIVRDMEAGRSGFTAPTGVSHPPRVAHP
jgi:hypothetical protein